MKVFLIPLALISSAALACPGDASKDAMAPANSQPVAAAKAAPAAKPAATVASSKPATKVAVKATVEQRKPSQL